MLLALTALCHSQGTQLSLNWSADDAPCSQSKRCRTTSLRPKLGWRMRTSIACSIRCSILFATSPQFGIELELERLTALYLLLLQPPGQPRQRRGSARSQAVGRGSKGRRHRRRRGTSYMQRVRHCRLGHHQSEGMLGSHPLTTALILAKTCCLCDCPPLPMHLVP